MIYAVVNVNAMDMKELICSTHATLENARWAEECMTGYSVETEVIEYTPEAMAKIQAQIEMIEEMRECIRTGIRRSARASAASIENYRLCRREQAC